MCSTPLQLRRRVPESDAGHETKHHQARIALGGSGGGGGGALK